MSNFKMSAAGLTALKSEEGSIDGIYDDPSGFATFGVGHLVHSGSRWGSFLLAAAKSSTTWSGKLQMALDVTYLPRTAVGWADFAALKTTAVELGTETIAMRKYGKSVDKLKPAEKKTATALAENAIRVESMLLANTVDSVLAADIVPFERAVNTLVRDGVINQDEFDALVMLTFNIGIGNFKSSTILTRVNEQRHRVGDLANRELGIQRIAEAFGMWRRSGGRVLQGLVDRRGREADRFLKRARDEAAALRKLKPFMGPPNLTLPGRLT